MLTVNDCLEIVYDDFMRNDNLSELVPLDVWEEPDNGDMEGWEEVSGWAYRWYDSDTGYLTDNEWTGMFDTEQEAFEDAYEHYGPYDDTESVLPWYRYAKNNGLTFRLWKVVEDPCGYTNHFGKDYYATENDILMVDPFEAYIVTQVDYADSVTLHIRQRIDENAVDETCSGKTRIDAWILFLKQYEIRFEEYVQ